jgi:hypothetical protein
MAAWRFALVLCVAAACGKGSGGSAPPPPKRDDAGSAAAPRTRVELAARPLGVETLDAYLYRKRGGHAAYRAARKAESRGDWPTVVTQCRAALAADATHVDAAWLLAAALAHETRWDELVEPLSLAVAADFQKYARPSLELAQLSPWLATAMGEAWKRRVEADRAAYLEALARAIVIEAGGELYAYDPKLARYHRLTRAGGGVVGAMRAPLGSREIAYVVRQGPKGKRELAVGVVDLGKGTTTRTAGTGTLGPISISYSKADSRFLVGIGAAGAKQTWRALGAGKLDAPKPGVTRVAGPRLDVTRKTARLYALPQGAVVADWDEQRLASAMRVGSSNKVITVPSPGLIDGNTVVWSPNHTHVAFVAQLQADTVCTPGSPRAAAYTADAATGAARLLHMPSIASGTLDKGLAVEWISDRTLAVASAAGVSLFSLDGAPPVQIPGAEGLVTPSPRPRCQPATDDDDSTPDDAEVPETASGGSPEMVGPPP